MNLVVSIQLQLQSEVAEMTEADSSQRCRVKGQDAKDKLGN